MRWKGRRESGNVVDQRSFSGKKMGGGALILGAIVYYLMGGNPLDYVAQNMSPTGGQAPISDTQDNEKKSFASVVLADTEDVWSTEFKNESLNYRPPKMVLFRNQVESACGRASSATGPFYCPADQRVYLDLSFFDALSQKLGATGDFASAYVIAHEVGHHIQTLLGIDRSAREQQARMNETNRNRVSVQVELMADCLAGAWAKQTEATKGVIEAGDIDEALNAASAIGDDRLQQMSQGQVMPDSFTHGTSAQRQAAFRKGYDNGELKSCVQGT